jgi:hypothetical protein
VKERERGGRGYILSTIDLTIDIFSNTDDLDKPDCQQLSYIEMGLD